MPEGARESLRVLCLSYPWLQPDDPDPKGTTLRLLGRVLEKFVDWQGTYAVFIDFCCLHQVDPATNQRAEHEQALFKRALAKCVWACPSLASPSLTAPPPCPAASTSCTRTRPRSSSR